MPHSLARPDYALSDALWATEVGADAFMHKPVDIHALLGTLERLEGTA